MLFKNVLLALAAVSTALVSAEKRNTLSSDFDHFPKCMQEIFQSTPSTKCETHIVPECYCKDAPFLLKVTAKRGKECTKAEGEDAYKKHCKLCLH